MRKQVKTINEDCFNNVIKMGNQIIEKDFKVLLYVAQEYMKSLQEVVKALFSDFQVRVNAIHRVDSKRFKSRYYELGVRGRISFNSGKALVFEIMLVRDKSLRFKSALEYLTPYGAYRKRLQPTYIKTYSDAVNVVEYVKNLKILESLLH